MGWLGRSHIPFPASRNIPTRTPFPATHLAARTLARYVQPDRSELIVQASASPCVHAHTWSDRQLGLQAGIAWGEPA